MKTFRAMEAPQDPAELPGFLMVLQQAIVDAANRSQSSTQRDILHMAPTKTVPGMEVNADGTDWNPGSGAGVYRRNEANSAWVHLG
jgi:hypothetical protein